MNEMTITTAQHLVWHETTKAGIRATINGSVVHVPLDPANRHYAEILRQVDAGTLTIEDAE